MTERRPVRVEIITHYDDGFVTFESADVVQTATVAPGDYAATTPLQRAVRSGEVKGPGTDGERWWDGSGNLLDTTTLTQDEKDLIAGLLDEEPPLSDQVLAEPPSTPAAPMEVVWPTAAEPIPALSAAAVDAKVAETLGPKKERRVVARGRIEEVAVDVSTIPVCGSGPDPYDGGLYCELAPKHRGAHRSAATSW